MQIHHLLMKVYITQIIMKTGVDMVVVLVMAGHVGDKQHQLRVSMYV